MKTKYVEDDCCYLISNFGTARSPIFLSQSDCKNFSDRVKKHLSPICRVLSYGFCNYEFRLVVSLRSRSEFEHFYLQKKKGKIVDVVPESTYILSQEMANIQSGYAKWFNHRYTRKGALFARRFSKRIIGSEERLLEVVNNVNNLYKIEQYAWRWKYRNNSQEGFGKWGEVKDRGIITKMVENKGRLSPVQNARQFILQGHFKTPSIPLKI